MALPLENVMTWEELHEHTLKQIGHKIKQSEKVMFKKWFMKRESIGKLFDSVMVLRCFNIWKQLNSKLDHFIVLDGTEGFGKSTFSFQIAAWVNPNFDMNNICYGAKSYLDILGNKAKICTDNNWNGDITSESLVLDEGTELLSRETQNITNRILVKSFFIQRVLKFLVLVNIPNFFMLDNVIRNHRVKTLIHLTARGKYKCITGKGIKKVAKEGRDTKDVNGVRLKDGTFWTGDFRKEFPKTIDRKKYEDYKLKSVREALEQMKDDVVHRKMIAATKVAREIGAAPNTIINMIKKGDIEGKMIGSKYYLTRKAYDKLLSP